MEFTLTPQHQARQSFIVLMAGLYPVLTAGRTNAGEDCGIGCISWDVYSLIRSTSAARKRRFSAAWRGSAVNRKSQLENVCLYKETEADSMPG